MDTFAIIAAATFLAAFSRALQNLCIVNKHYVSVLFIPFLIAVSDVGIVLGVVASGWAAVPPMGVGGAIGAVTAMALHGRFWRR
jgi:hypothetical protein